MPFCSALTRTTALDMDSSTFNVLLIGAGEINFGSVEGSWNHSIRLESLYGQKLNVLGLLDVDSTKAQDQINQKKASGALGYSNTRIFKNLDEALPHLRNERIDLAILGIPPHFRGSILPDADFDLRLIEALPQVTHWLVEKPVSAKQPSKEAGQAKVAKAWVSCNAIVGVGYHLASLKAVHAARQIIKDKNLKIMATEARYNMAYEFARKPSWWNKTVSCGPIVEQATHLANLSLLFAGQASLSTVMAHTVEYDEVPGHLSKLGIDEDSLIPAESRVPRYTNAIWKYKNGAVGNLSHSIALHGNTYDTELTIICDGNILKLVDLYKETSMLIVMEDGKAEPTITKFEKDDAYMTQLESLLQGNPACTYEQALETYDLTWAIRLSAEEQQRKRRA